MLRWLVVLVVLLLAGCASLPSDIARHAGATSTGCVEAATKTFNALGALEYKDVTYCEGQVWDGVIMPRHAWVEYTDDSGDVRIVDPYCILEESVCEYWRADLCEWEYVRTS